MYNKKIQETNSPPFDKRRTLTLTPTHTLVHIIYGFPFILRSPFLEVFFLYPFLVSSLLFSFVIDPSVMNSIVYLY